MNDKDKEAFKEWYQEYFRISGITILNIPHHFTEAWQAACDYKEAENKKLREALNLISEIGYYHDYGIHRDFAIEALKQLEG